MVISLILAAVIVGLDQLTKALIYGMEAPIIGDFLKIESTLNTGASFGMMQDSTVMFIVVTIPVVAAMIYVICSKKYLNKFNKICLGVILGGSVGNLIDRLIFGGVRDFISLKYFAIFNVADIAITVGVIMFIVGLIVQICKGGGNNKEKQPAEDEKLEQLKGLRDELKKEVKKD